MASLYERPTTDYHRGIHSTNKMRQHVAQASKPGHIGLTSPIGGGTHPDSPRAALTWSEQRTLLSTQYPNAGKKTLDSLADMAINGKLGTSTYAQPKAGGSSGRRQSVISGNPDEVPIGGSGSEKPYDAPRPPITGWKPGADGSPEPVYGYDPMKNPWLEGDSRRRGLPGSPRNPLPPKIELGGAGTSDVHYKKPFLSQPPATDAPRPPITGWKPGSDGSPEPVWGYKPIGPSPENPPMPTEKPHHSSGMADSRARINALPQGSSIKDAGFQVAPNLYQQNQQAIQRGRIMNSLKSKRYSQPSGLSPSSQAKADAYAASLQKDGSSDRFAAPNKITVTPLETDTPGKKMPSAPTPTYQRPQKKKPSGASGSW